MTFYNNYTNVTHIPFTPVGYQHGNKEHTRRHVQQCKGQSKPSVSLVINGLEARPRSGENANQYY